MSAAYLDLPVAQAIFGDPARGAGMGARPPGSRGRMRGRLPGDRRLVVCLRRPACDLARRALPDFCGGRLTQMRRQRRSARTHHAGAHRGRRVDRHLEHRRPARHRQRPVRAQRFLRPRRPFDHPRVRPRMPRARSAVPHEQPHLLPDGFCRRRLRHRPHRARQFRRDDAHQGAARHEAVAAGQCRGSIQPRTGGSQSPRRTRLRAAVDGRYLERPQRRARPSRWRSA